MSTLSEAIEIALKLHQSGDLDRAEEVYQQVLKADPENSDTLHLLGVIAIQKKLYRRAVDYIEQAIQLKPDESLFHFHLGQAYEQLDIISEAEACFRRSTELGPDNESVYLQLGDLLTREERLVEAIQLYSTALDRYPDRPEILIRLGNVFQKQGKLDDAISIYESAVQQRASSIDLFNNLGTALCDVGRILEAIKYFQKALGIADSDPRIHFNLANALKDEGRWDDAIAHFQMAIDLQPNFTVAHNCLANTWKERGDIKKANECYQTGSQFDPGSRAVWQLKELSLCPVTFQNRDEVDDYSRRFLDDVRKLAESPISLDFSNQLYSGCEPSFNLQFLHGNLKSLKEGYASVFRVDPASVLETNKCSEKPRLGIVVTAGHEMAFSRSMCGFLRRMSFVGYDVCVICAPSGQLKIQGNLKESSIEVVPCLSNLKLAVEFLKKERFDVLFYREIGTDAFNYFLPFFCPASIQCLSHGSQVTSGIPAVDYYLSSEIVESQSVDAHYSEKLILAKTILPYREKNLKLPSCRERDYYGISESKNVYLCAQQLGKFHPDFDLLIAGTLREDSNGIFITTSDLGGHVASKLKQRFSITIPDVCDRIVFVPFQKEKDYLSLIACADVLLDPPHFSGFHSTFDALELNKPIVTIPSEHRRGRFTFGCYKMMEFMDCVAENSEQYVEVAARLGRDRDYRCFVSQEIEKRGQVLFDSMETVHEHERIFERLIQEAQQ